MIRDRVNILAQAGNNFNSESVSCSLSMFPDRSATRMSAYHSKIHDISNDLHSAISECLEPVRRDPRFTVYDPRSTIHGKIRHQIADAEGGFIGEEVRLPIGFMKRSEEDKERPQDRIRSLRRSVFHRD